MPKAWCPMTAALAVDDVVDLKRLASWLTANGLGDTAIEDAVLLSGGTQNLLVSFRSGGRDIVLRRPPLQHRPNSGKLLLREATVLAALAATTVPHPRLLGVETDLSVCGSAFLLMERVPGFNPVTALPEQFNHQDGRERLATQATDALAQIGALDYVALGLDQFGRPEGFLSRQVSRWVAERDGYADLPGYPGMPLPGFATVADYLARRVPPTFRPGLMHGDFHFGNLLFDATTATLVAVLDWEMSTIGDPLLDLGRYLAMWPDGDETIITGGIWDAGPLPTPTEVAQRYARICDRDLDHLDWYVVMGCFKLGVILEGSYARACAGHTTPEIGSALHDMAVRLFHRAQRLIERG